MNMNKIIAIGRRSKMKFAESLRVHMPLLTERDTLDVGRLAVAFIHEKGLDDELLAYMKSKNKNLFEERM